MEGARFISLDFEQQMRVAENGKRVGGLRRWGRYAPADFFSTREALPLPPKQPSDDRASESDHDPRQSISEPTTVR